MRVVDTFSPLDLVSALETSDQRLQTPSGQTGQLSPGMLPSPLNSTNS